MENANQGDNIFLTQRSVLPILCYAKNLNMEDMRYSPTPSGECKEIPANVMRKHRSRFETHPRPRSSPVRPALSETSSPERRARSPSESSKRRVLPDPPELPAATVLSPHDSLYTHQLTPDVRPSATSYYSPQPPSIPLYIVPLPPTPSATAAQIEKNMRSKHQSRVEAKNKTGRKIARQLLRSILKKLPINTDNVAVGVNVAVANSELEVYPSSNRSIATQALSKNENNRIKTTDAEDEFSTSESSDYDYVEGYEWAGSVRALRNSHVRLVLRQLRHLRDIERLGKALRHRGSHE